MLQYYFGTKKPEVEQALMSSPLHAQCHKHALKCHKITLGTKK